MWRTTLLAFSLVLALGCAEAEPGNPGPLASGVRGRVVAGPTCPVQTLTSPCPPKPVQTTVAVEPLSGDGIVTVDTGADGTFRVSLEPGGYLLTARPPVDPAARWIGRSATVTVEPGAYTRVTLFLDTGLREPQT